MAVSSGAQLDFVMLIYVVKRIGIGGILRC
jgi:hypothetical protein